jgi:hypothetical protein
MNLEMVFVAGLDLDRLGSQWTVRLSSVTMENFWKVFRKRSTWAAKRKKFGCLFFEKFHYMFPQSVHISLSVPKMMITEKYVVDPK